MSSWDGDSIGIVIKWDCRIDWGDRLGSIDELTIEEYLCCISRLPSGNIKMNKALEIAITWL